MQSRRLLCRRLASEYFVTQHGLEISPEKLAHWAVRGGGPRFRLLAGRISQAVYDTMDLDDWAGRYLGPLVAHVAEHPAYQQRNAAA
jgi:hypothetical protein